MRISLGWKERKFFLKYNERVRDISSCNFLRRDITKFWNTLYTPEIKPHRILTFIIQRITLQVFTISSSCVPVQTLGLNAQAMLTDGLVTCAIHKASPAPKSSIPRVHSITPELVR
jgi:hypothetical protein